MSDGRQQQQRAPFPYMEEFWGGLAAMLVALPSAVAFGVLVYSALGTEYKAHGAMAGMLGAAALGLVAPFIGRTRGLISAPCAPAAAVLSALALEFATGKGGNVPGPAEIGALLALTAFVAALLQILYGIIGGGRLIKFIPYPVVSGYLSGVGVLIALGQLPKLFGLPKGTPLWEGVLSPAMWRWEGLAVGLLSMTVIGFAPRITRKVPAAILGLLAGMILYAVLGCFSPALFQLEENPLVIGSIEATGSFLDAVKSRAAILAGLDFSLLRTILVPALTLSVLLSIDTLKTCVVLDALTRNRHNSNRELVGQGIGNMAAFFAGGIPGAGTMGPSLVNITSGGRTARAGIIEGGLVVFAMLFLIRVIAWMPIGALAGILLMIAWRMIDKSMLRLLRYRSGRLDFAVIAGVVFAAVTVDLIAAAGVGIILAILLFIRDQMRGSVIRRKIYLNQISSKTRRLSAERDILNRLGDQGVFCELQGNLFFGTTDQLYSQLEPDLRKLRFILLDMRRVQSLDFTAAHLLEQMQAQLAERGGRLLFSGMPSAVLDQRDFEHDLMRVGAVRETGGVMISDTLDGALEWIEDRIIESAGAKDRREEDLLGLKDIDLFRGFDDDAIARLAACMRVLTVAPGETVCAHGEQSDEMFFVRRGQVQALLPLEGGKRHHLATFGQGDFFGELAFLDRGRRSADVEAKTAADLFVLSRGRFDEQAAPDSTLGTQVFSRMALAIAHRLRRADMELRILEER